MSCWSHNPLHEGVDNQLLIWAKAVMLKVDYVSWQQDKCLSSSSSEMIRWWPVTATVAPAPTLASPLRRRTLSTREMRIRSANSILTEGLDVPNLSFHLYRYWLICIFSSIIYPLVTDRVILVRFVFGSFSLSKGSGTRFYLAMIQYQNGPHKTIKVHYVL